MEGTVLPLYKNSACPHLRVPSAVLLSASQEGPNEVKDARRERQLQ